MFRYSIIHYKSYIMVIGFYPMHYKTGILMYFRGPGGGDQGPPGPKGEKGDAAPTPLGPISKLQTDTSTNQNVRFANHLSFSSASVAQHCKGNFGNIFCYRFSEFCTAICCQKLATLHRKILLWEILNYSSFFAKVRQKSLPLVLRFTEISG